MGCHFLLQEIFLTRDQIHIFCFGGRIVCHRAISTALRDTTATAAGTLQSCPTRPCAAHRRQPAGSPPLGLSRQEHGSGLPLPSPVCDSEVMSDSSDPMDFSLPGSSVHGIFQAGVLEWAAIAFSGCKLRHQENK